MVSRLGQIDEVLYLPTDDLLSKPASRHRGPVGHGFRVKPGNLFMDRMSSPQELEFWSDLFKSSDAERSELGKIYDGTPNNYDAFREYLAPRYKDLRQPGSSRSSWQMGNQFRFDLRRDLAGEVRRDRK
jgi:hypothetical protein